MLFGRRDQFVYAECAACASLQIREVPANLADYYPTDYYSYDLPESVQKPPEFFRRLASWLITALPGCTPLTRRLALRYPFLHWARLGAIGHRDAVLDVGCGAGVELHRMRRWGYSNLTGIDPYMRKESREPELILSRATLDEIDGRFALIMMNHVLEHLPDPGAALRAARDRLQPGGRILVRLPIAGSPLARAFGADWFALDPPRHLVIPSRAGFLKLSANNGLVIRHEEYDSTELSILYSECYRKNIPVKEAPKPGTPADRKRALRRIKRMNARGEGDCGLFVLTTV